MIPKKSAACVPSIVTSATAVPSLPTKSRRTRTARSGNALVNCSKYGFPTTSASPWRFSGTRVMLACGVTSARAPLVSRASILVRSCVQRQLCSFDLYPQFFQDGFSRRLGRIRVLACYQVAIDHHVGYPVGIAVVKDGSIVL